MTPDSQADFRALVDELPLFVWSQAADGRVEWANRAWHVYAGLPGPAATSPKGWADVVHPDDLGPALEAFGRAAAAGTAYEGEVRIRHAGGDDAAYRWFLVRSVPRRSLDAALIGWTGTGVDVHDAKVLAERDAESFRTIADAVPQMMWSARADGWIDWYNARWYEYTGQSVEEAQGWGWQAVHHPDDLPHVMQRWPHSIASGERFEMEFRLRAADGRFRWFLTRATPVRDADGTIARWYGTNTDIDAEYKARTRERFFSRLGTELAGALSLEQTLRVVTQRIVPEFADWTLVNLIDDHADVRLAAAYHRDEELRRLLETMRGERYVNLAAQAGTAEVIRRKTPIVYESVHANFPREAVRERFVDIFARIGLDSVLVVPLFSGGRLVGTLNAVMSGSGRAFSRADVPFFEELGRRITPAIGNATAYERERRVATTFQRAALVPSLPRVPGLTFDAIYQAAMLEATVGGDWYDAFRLPDGRVVLSVGDVAGKGLEAAVAMASVRQSIRTAALINPEPVAILNAVDRIVRAMGQAPFVTAFVGVLDPVTFELVFASAGHPPALLRDPGGGVIALTQGDLPLGLRQRETEAGITIDVSPGSVLLCYTDGLTEFDRDPVSGESHVARALAEASGAIAHEIYAAVSSGRPAEDDVALLAVTFDRPLTDLEGPRRALRWSFDAADGPAAGRARRDLVAQLRAAGMQTGECTNAELVFSELVGNVVRYAPGRVEAILDLAAESAVLHVLDDGLGFEFRPRLPADVMSERGRGLFLVTAFADEVSVERRRGGGSHARAVLVGQLHALDRAGRGDVLR